MEDSEISITPGTSLESTLGAIIESLKQLTVENQQLRSKVDSISHVQRPEPRIALPDKFDGDRRKLRGFMNQIELLFALNPSRYPNDSTKVAFIGSLLSGKALAWFNPLFENRIKYATLLANYSSFTMAFQNTFGDPDRMLMADAHLRDLHQGAKPASSYAAEFKAVSSDVDWNEAALISQFRLGLRQELKDMLLYHDLPETLDAFVTLAIKCDNRLFEHQQEKKRNSSSNTDHRPKVNNQFQKRIQQSFHKSFSIPAASPSTRDDPMQIDSIKNFGPLTEIEKQRRKNQGLCMYCGGHHIRINCPIAPKIKPRVDLNNIKIQNDQKSKYLNTSSH
jgi:hypothetical protein